MKELLFKNTTFEIDHQVEFNQVAVWCKTFGKDWSICFQDGDMAGTNKGKAVWNNDGANEGIFLLREILINRPEFQGLIDNDTYWKYEAIDDLIYNFISDYAEKNNINSYFE